MERLILVFCLVGCSSAHPAPLPDAAVLGDAAVLADAALDAASPDAGLEEDAGALDVCALGGEPDELEAACDAWDNAALRARIIGCATAPPCPWLEPPTLETRVACANLFDTIETCEDAQAVADRCVCE
jgi:hypothetical protein